MLEHVVIASLSAFGSYQIVGRGRITQRLRDATEDFSPLLHELLTCAQCSGFWYGAVYALAFGAATPAALTRMDFIWLTSLPFITSGLALLGNDILDLINTARERLSPSLEDSSNEQA